VVGANAIETFHAKAVIKNGAGCFGHVAATGVGFIDPVAKFTLLVRTVNGFDENAANQVLWSFAQCDREIRAGGRLNSSVYL